MRVFTQRKKQELEDTSCGDILTYLNNPYSTSSTMIDILGRSSLQCLDCIGALLRFGTLADIEHLSYLATREISLDNNNMGTKQVTNHVWHI